MISALLLLAMVAAPGQDGGALDCENAMTQSAMTMCAAQDYDAADAALNVQWKKTAALMKAQDASFDYDDNRPGYFDSLLASQRAWLQYRDAHCRLVGYDGRGGSIEPMLVNGCLERVTQYRTSQLHDLTINQISQEPRSALDQ